MSCKVKKLKWTDIIDEMVSAQVLERVYWCLKKEDEDLWTTVLSRSYDLDTDYKYSLDEAKAVCQEHWEKALKEVIEFNGGLTDQD